MKDEVACCFATQEQLNYSTRRKTPKLWAKFEQYGYNILQKTKHRFIITRLPIINGC